MFNASMTFDLGDEVNALRDMVHRWAQARVKPLAVQVDKQNAFPEALWEEMGGLGLLGITVPEADGGAGMGYLAHVVAVEEIADDVATLSDTGVAQRHRSSRQRPPSLDRRLPPIVLPHLRWGRTRDAT